MLTLIFICLLIYEVNYRYEEKERAECLRKEYENYLHGDKKWI